MQLGQLKAKQSSHLSPLARSFTPGSTTAPSNARKDLQFLSLASPIEAPPSFHAKDSAAVLAQQRGRLNAFRALSSLPVPASAPIYPTGEDGRPITWGPPERYPAPIEEEPSTSAPTPSTGESSVPTPKEHESWSNMVPTPLGSMFPKDANGTQPSTTDGKPLWNAEGVVPQIGDAAIYRRGQKGSKKKNVHSPSSVHSMAGAIPPMPTPMGIIPTSPYNLGMLNAMGVSPEAQLLAVQMFVNGLIPTGYVGPPQYVHPAGRWRGQASAGLKSGGSAKSAGMKSASSNGPASGTINRDHETDPELLKDIPAWLKALRLHKYAHSFEGLSWKEMVVLDEAALESRGVLTVGARKRFLRLFETVRKSQGMEDPPTSEVEKVHVLDKVPVAVAVS
jgi:hypothetical protein